ncbi:MAG: membrane protein insertion efficiency factor YidD [Alphaproteobacteria bacterium 13_1_20CM_3_64_12]|jgi:putative membrane protein insertion efficiency factor|nr:MAG: membrane protein insertion efficiency factor YidD [Alphaproteobacteria bacterium 13_1_20CM_3_64_12]TMJ77033.1 MAG: membrane protein insertion efficiency factor YidD [Alphaproteobacteria bacterium]
MQLRAGASQVFGLAINLMIRAYQLLLAPVVPPSCRFYPSCSRYAAEAVERHGPWRGLSLACRRLLRCHPWGGSGYDPVPSKPSR